MLMAFIIGNLGADAQRKEEAGRKFTTFRVAHNERWTGQDGVEHNTTQWIDCVMNDHPRVVDFLVQGATVAVMGYITPRVFSSAKDRCMKAGISCRVQSVELVGGRIDPVPSRLYDENGVQHDIQKCFHTDVANVNLMTPQGRLFIADQNGWVMPVQQTSEQAQTADSSQKQEQ